MALGALGCVRELHKTWWASRTLAHAHDAAVAAVGECLLVEDLDRHGELLRELLCPLRERLGVQKIRRGVDQVANEVNALGNLFSAIRRAFEGLEFLLIGDGENDLLNGLLVVLEVTLVFAVGVGAESCTFESRSDVCLGGGREGKGDACVAGEGSRSGTKGVADVFARDIFKCLGAEANADDCVSAVGSGRRDRRERSLGATGLDGSEGFFER